MEKNTIVGFSEKGVEKFPKIRDRVFLYLGEIPNNPNYVIVRGFRGRFAFGEEFIEQKDDIAALTESEVSEFFSEVIS